MNQRFFVLALTLIAIPVFAAPKSQAYPASCGRVWAAVKRVAVPPHYNFAMLDDAQKKGIVSTGNNLSGKRNLDITLSGTGDSCTAAIGGTFSGLAHNDKGDLYARIEKELTSPSGPTQEQESKK